MGLSAEIRASSVVNFKFSKFNNLACKFLKLEMLKIEMLGCTYIGTLGLLRNVLSSQNSFGPCYIEAKEDHPEVSMFSYTYILPTYQCSSSSNPQGPRGRKDYNSVLKISLYSHVSVTAGKDYLLPPFRPSVHPPVCNIPRQWTSPPPWHQLCSDPLANYFIMYFI